MRILFALLVVFALTGFTACQRRPTAPVADADDECYRAVTPSLTDTGVRWEGDPENPETWDDLGIRVVPALTDLALTGERRRQACAGFIEDLKKRGVLRTK